MKSFTAIAIFITFTAFAPCYGKKTNQSISTHATKDTILVYGLPNFERENAENVIAQKWGIVYYAIAGCVVSEEMVDDAEEHNKKVYTRLERKFGKGWEIKFEKEVDEEFRKEQLVLKTVEHIDYIVKKNTALGLEGNWLHYCLEPDKNPEEYTVSVEGWDKINNEDKWVSFYRLKVNYKTGKHRLISDIIEPRN